MSPLKSGHIHEFQIHVEDLVARVVHKDRTHAGRDYYRDSQVCVFGTLRSSDLSLMDVSTVDVENRALVLAKDREEPLCEVRSPKLLEVE